MDIREEMKNLAEFRDYMEDLIRRETERGISANCERFLRSMLMCTEQDLWQKEMEVRGIAELRKILLDDKNDWEG